MPQSLQLELTQDELQTLLVALHTLNAVCETPALDSFRHKVIDDANSFFNFLVPSTAFTSDTIGLPADTLYNAYYERAMASGTLKPIDEHYVPIVLDLSAHVVTASQS